MSAPRPTFVAAVLIVGVALGACTARPRALVDHPPQRGDEAGPPFNWDAPQALDSFIPVTDVSKYASDLSFVPIEPALGGLLNTYLTDPSKVLKNGMLIEYYYQDPTYGRLVVKEILQTIQQSDLEARLSYNSDENFSATFALVTLKDGTEAVLETQKSPSADGLAPNSIEFFEGGTDVTIFGPDGTFTSDAATQVANLLLPAK